MGKDQQWEKWFHAMTSSCRSQETMNWSHVTISGDDENLAASFSKFEGNFLGGVFKCKLHSWVRVSWYTRAWNWKRTTLVVGQIHRSIESGKFVSGRAFQVTQIRNLSLVQIMVFARSVPSHYLNLWGVVENAFENFICKTVGYFVSSSLYPVGGSSKSFPRAKLSCRS